MNAAAASVFHPPRKLCGVFLSSALALLTSGTVSVKSATILSDCNEAALRSTLAQGGEVVVACDGTISLTAVLTITVDTMVDATGHQLALSGGHTVRIFDVATNVQLSLVNLSIVDGRSTNGGGILNEGGVVNVTNCSFSHNEAAQPPLTTGQPPTMAAPPSQGGAICNLGGLVNLDSCRFTGNSAYGAPDSLIAFAPGGDALGGAIYSDGHLQAHTCTFQRNSAMGGSGGDGVFFPGSFGMGGGSGGLAGGGAICNLGWMAVDRSLFASNNATGGRGGNGGSAANMPPAVGPGQNGGNGGYASGAALFNGSTAALINCTFAHGVSSGSMGGQGGVGSDFWWQGVHYQFGNGMDGLLGKGCGGLWNASGAKLYVTNCTVAFNSGSAPNSGLRSEAAITGDDVKLVNTLLATNSPNNGTNVLIDLGHNLSSDTSCSFTGPGSSNNTDPRIGSLADNGGPTLTIALLPDSPAIDAADPVTAPSVDQRGFVRPVGDGPDIGAFELSPTPPTILVSPQSQIAAIGTTVNFDVQATGSARLAYQWTFNSTNAIAGATGSSLQLLNVQAIQSGAYTVRVTNEFGTATSSPALLSVVAAGPRVVTSPTNRTEVLGATTDFSVDADGSLPLSYQWVFNNIEIIPGATGSRLELTNLQLSQSGSYSVVVTNAFGAVTSSPALLTVIGVPPVISIQPSNQTTVVGGNIELRVGANGSLPLTYQWSFNGTNLITGALDAVLELTDVQLSQSGTYEVVVHNAFGTAASSRATVTITPPGTTAVVDPLESSLRAAVTNGGRVILACEGTIQLTSALTISSDTLLDGNGHEVTISGAGLTRVFYVSPRTRFQLQNLTVAAGYANDGAGLLNDLGTVTITNCVFARHRAARGAAVFNTGTLTLSRCSFTYNSAEGATGADGANQVIVPPPWPGAGGEADGGGIYNSGTLFVDASLFASNTATGGAGGRGSPGDYYVLGSYPTGGGSGGAGLGGALFNVGTGALVNCTFAWNQGLGGGGGAGGAYSGPSPYADFGTGGANGAMGVGAAQNSGGQLNLTNCTIAFNSGSGGGGGPGGAARVPGPGGAGGDGVGGICNPAGLNLVNCAVTLNVGNGAQGGYGATGTRLHIDYGNGPQGASAGNFGGAVTDLGHNLASDATFAPTGEGSIISTNPLLGPLANNGGATMTIALLPGSPAIDAGDTTVAPLFDQRGVPRPIGLSADIGAYEYGYPLALRIRLVQSPGFEITVSGLRDQPIHLSESSDFKNWLPVVSAQIGTNGIFLYQGQLRPGPVFYRAVSP